jgi:hypothetical protein
MRGVPYVFQRGVGSPGTAGVRTCPSVAGRRPRRAADGDLHALAGLANFQLERYDAATQHYIAALQADGLRSDWREMLALAQANDTDGVNVYVPALHYYDRNALLAPASLRTARCPRCCRPGRGRATSSDCASSWASRSV